MQQLSTITEFPSEVLQEFESHGLSLDDSSFCEVLPATIAYKSMTAYCARELCVGSVAVDKNAEQGCLDEDEENDDTLGEWEENGVIDGEDVGENDVNEVEEKKEGKETVRRRKVGPGPKVKLVLGLGVYAVKVGKEVVYMAHFSRGNPINKYDGPETYRALVIVVKGRGKERLEFVKEFLQKAVDWYKKDSEPTADVGKFALYRYKVRDKQGWWNNDGFKRGRPLESVILPAGLKESIVKDTGDFLDEGTKKWYVEHGLPHRRSYLFYGPPGVGKSSMIRALAGKYQLNACFLSMGNNEFNNELLGDALHECPGNALLVLEDVDCLFENREASKGVALTFSGLLNALDGMMSSDGRITVMTTNHLDKLDPAMIRCGRVDRRFEFPLPVKDQVEKLFCAFYPDAEKNLYQEFSKAVWNREEDEARSIATLQQFFIFCRKDSAEVALTRIAEFFEGFFPHGAKKKNPMYT